MVGPKGTGKGTMILDAMRAVDAEGAGFCEGALTLCGITGLTGSSS